MKFDAARFAVAWRSVAVAAQKNEIRRVLSKSVLVEVYRDGVRLTATDQQLLITSWVPALGSMTEPLTDEAPDQAIVVLDPNGRAKGLLSYAQNLQRALDADETSDKRLTLRIEVTRDPSALAGLGSRRFTMQLEESERLTLDTHDEEYEQWRNAWTGFTRDDTDYSTQPPNVLAQLAKVAQIGASPLGFEYGEQAHRWHVLDSEPVIEGLLFPKLWDVSADAPMTGVFDVDDAIQDALAEELESQFEVER